MQSLPNGTTLGEYTLIRLIGRGGMGEVYEAYEAKLHRRVALKIIAPLEPDQHDLEDLYRRFLQEARTLAQVNHPNIVTIYNIDRIGGAQFIAMEYVNGLALKQVLKEFSLSYSETIPMFAQILEGLHYLHQNHILHRDLKPHNILLRTDGQIKILDFGIAKQTLPGHSEGTVVGVIAGTLPYMAPEVRAGDPATPASDIWSLGAIFYELLVGKPLSRVMIDHPDSTDVPWSREDATRIPSGLRKIISKMCAHKVQNRYRNTARVIEELKKFRGEQPPTPPEIYESLVKKVGALSELRRKEHTGDFSFTSVRNSPMGSGYRTNNPDRRKSKRRSKKSKIDLVSIAVAAGGLALAAFTWLAWKRAGSSAPPGARVAASTTEVVPPPPPAAPPHTVEIATTTETKLVPPLVLMEPHDGEALWLQARKIPVLSWSRTLPNEDYLIQIAADAEFNALLVSEPVSGNTFSPEAPLPEGNYFWRLVGRSMHHQNAGPNRFSLNFLTPLVLTHPRAQQTWSQADLKNDAEFAWRCKPGADLYKFQIGEDPVFQVVVKEQLARACRLRAPAIKPGTYYWRIRTENAGTADAIWSETRTLIIRPPAPPIVAAVSTPPPSPKRTRPTPPIEAPKPSKPSSRARPRVAQLERAPESTSDSSSQTDSSAGEESNSPTPPPPALAPPSHQRPSPGARAPSRNGRLSVMFSWSANPSVEMYALELAGDAEFNQILQRIKTPKNSVLLKQARLRGRVFWRVRAEGRSGNSEWSAPSYFDVY